MKINKAFYVPRAYRSCVFRGRFSQAHRLVYPPTRRAVPPDDFSLLTAVLVCLGGAVALWLGAFL